MALLLTATLIFGTAVIAGVDFTDFIPKAEADGADPEFSQFTDGNYVYTVIDGEAMILNYNGTLDGEFTVPSELGEYKVTSIGWGAFYKQNFTSVVIPEGIKEIKASAFAYCENLANIVLPDSLQSVGYLVFENTAYRNNADNWENELLYIGSCLIGCNEKVGSNVNIKSGTKIIADGTFASGDLYSNNGGYINNIKSVSIPGSVKRICSGAFSYCENLETIAIAEGARGIESFVFYGTAYYEDSANWDGDALYIGNHLIEVKNSASGSFEIRPGTVEIAAEAFYGCEDITNITIPDSVDTIGYGAFIDCSLKNIVIPNGVTAIERQTFSTFNNEATLEYVHIPSSVTYISGTYYDGYIDYETFGDYSVIICSDTENCYAKTYAEENGMTFKVCDGHGILAPHYHSYVSCVTVEPGCESYGVRTYSCSCGDYYTESISPAGHKYGDWTVSKEATAAEKGIKIRTCSSCGDTEEKYYEVSVFEKIGYYISDFFMKIADWFTSIIEALDGYVGSIEFD